MLKIKKQKYDWSDTQEALAEFVMFYLFKRWILSKNGNVTLNFYGLHIGISYCIISKYFIIQILIWKIELSKHQNIMATQKNVNYYSETVLPWQWFSLPGLFPLGGWRLILTQFIEPSYSRLCSWLAHDNHKGRTFISENQILADSTVFPLIFFLKCNSDENLFPVNRIVISKE